jgi:hypothetical protein
MISKRNFVKTIGATGVCLLSGCAGIIDDVESAGEPSVEEVKENSESVAYDELYRNISDYEGEYVHYEKLSLSSVIEGEGNKEYLLTFPGGGFDDERALYALWDGDPFKDGDQIEVWGIVQGLKSFNSTAGERTVPEVKLVDIELV